MTPERMSPQNVEKFIQAFRLLAYSAQNCDLRIGQAICNAVPDDNLYNVEDDVLVESIARYAAKLSQ